MKTVVALGLLVLGCDVDTAGPFLPPPGHIGGLPKGDEAVAGGAAGSVADAAVDGTGAVDAGSGGEGGGG